MAYKKYIRRGGKTYGPYLYHSRRENGQVITEYHGKESNKKFFKIFLFAFVGLFVLAGLYSILSNLSFQSTGLASLQLATNYKPNENVDGVLRLSLLKGELIPESTSVVIDIAGEEKNYSLIELISEEGVQGNYYVKDSKISGTGLGYGSQGAKYSDPEVDFKLSVVDVSETSSETIPSETTETPTESTESNVSESETPQSEETPSITNETSAETSSETPTINGGTSETPTEESTETPMMGETNPTITTPNQLEPPLDTQDNNLPSESSRPPQGTTSETPTETPTETIEPSAGNAVTGGIIKFFTGLASLDFAKEEINGIVDGKVVYGESVEYNIPEGKTAVLIEGSVYSEGEKIDDSYVDISVSNGVAIVSTNYRKAEYGFGEGYVGSEKVYYDINLSKLDLTAKEGKMNIKLVFDSSVIVETNSDLAVSVEELNATEKNASIGAEPFKLEDSSVYDLTDDEIKLLTEKAGTISVNTTKSEILNGRLVLKYELGDYWTEFSYDYEGDISKNLLDKIELERKYWLKNLAKELSKETSEVESVGDLVVGFNLNESNSLKLKGINASEEIKKEVKEEKNKTEENVTEVVENETSPTPPPQETPVITNETSTETPVETPTETNTTENTEQSPEFGITGQTISPSQSSVSFFDRIRNFTGRIISSIRESFS